MSTKVSLGISVRFLLTLVILTFVNNGMGQRASTTEIPSKSDSTTVERPPTTFDLGMIPQFDDINSKTRKSEIFKMILEGSYDTQIRPPVSCKRYGKNIIHSLVQNCEPIFNLLCVTTFGIFGTGPAFISISMYIRSIENLDDVAMEYRAQMTFRQEWIDPRLRYDHLEPNISYLTLSEPSRIWVPDIFFSNEKESKLHDLMIPNVFTRVFPNGRILQSYRITTLLSCPMNLRSYPLDIQSCPIRMACYGFTTRDIVLQWRKEIGVEMAREFSMPRFKLQNYSIESCLSVTSSGAFGCLQLQLTFTRQLGYYLIQFYCPTTMLVVISWVSFWLEPSATEARISLGVTTILTIVTETYGINQSVPPASYIKGIDIWTTACEVMVVSALLQFAIINYITQFQWKKISKKYLSNTKDVELKRRKEVKLQERAQRKAKRVDLISKVIFPAVFISFNIIYWTYYLNVSHANN